MTDLHDFLDSGAQNFRPSPGAWGELQRRVHLRHRRRRQASGLTAAVIAIAATGFLVRAFNPPTPQVPISTPSAVPERLQAQVTDQIDVGPFPQAIAVGEGGVWVDVPANAPGASPEIVRIDPNSDSVVARIPVPEGESDIAAGEGSVWVTRDSRMQDGQLLLQTLRIDPATNTVIATLPDVGGQVAVGDGYLWALAAGSGDRPTTTVLVKIDPDTGSIISSRALGATVMDIAIGGGSVWLTTLPDPRSGTLIQVDASTIQVLHTLDLSFNYDSPVFADGTLWVPICCRDNNVALVRVDPATGETVGEPVDGGEGVPFAYAFGHLLLMSERGALSDLHPTSGIIETLAESDWPAAHGTTVFDPVSGSVWVSNYRRTVTRIDVLPSELGTSPANGFLYVRITADGGMAQVDAIRSDGTDQHVAFQAGTPPTNGHLAWTADGSRVAFDAYFGDHVGISTADPSGTSVTHLTIATNDVWPSWSPDGTMIAFASTRYDPSIDACPTGIDLRCRTDIYVMNSDGSGVTRLTTDPAPEWDPVWSPDGMQIAFVKGESETEVFIMQADGSNVRKVTTTEGGSGFAPSWSPDGRQIVFGSIQYEDWGIFVVDTDGTDERSLLFDPSTYAVEPAWSPDGSLIAFTGTVGGSARMGLYVMRPDGSGVAQISTDVEREYDSVSWGPGSS